MAIAGVFFLFWEGLRRSIEGDCELAFRRTLLVPSSSSPATIRQKSDNIVSRREWGFSSFDLWEERKRMVGLGGASSTGGEKRLRWPFRPRGKQLKRWDGGDVALARQQSPSMEDVLDGTALTSGNGSKDSLCCEFDV
ncbi:unnamed protein product [Lactuca virosa]|uniref:Uncharacterized protein n=1 Tax=Lactuca virosa TaxID=75947 RepID=A0AAU9P967_9ASTR|nr:unnamed protein product [Lactuca virosa]